MTPPIHSRGSPLNEFASIFRVGSSCSIAEPSPRAATNSAPFLLRDTAPAVLMFPYKTLASPVAGSICMTLPASLLANITEPLSPAMGPSTLLPSHDQTTFQDCPAASTPGIAVVAGRTGSGGAVLPAALLMGIANGFGGVLHFASTALIPGFCQLCW